MTILLHQPRCKIERMKFDFRVHATEFQNHLILVIQGGSFAWLTMQNRHFHFISFIFYRIGF